MSTPLADNPLHLNELCTRLDLGSPRAALIQVRGGFHHRVWRLQTDRNSYAIKQLADDIDLNNLQVCEHFDVSEAIGSAFEAAGVKCVHALADSGHYLQHLDQSGYLVFPWCEGESMAEGAISEPRAAVIAGVLARMHRAGVDIAGAHWHEFNVIEDEAIDRELLRANQKGIQHARTLNEARDVFLAIAAAHREAIPLLKKHLVISHGDLDQKNVLWTQAGEPLLIDWESARWLNPSYEALLGSLDWSGLLGDFNPQLCATFLAAYQQAGGVLEGDMLEAAFDCILGDWLYWLIYNVARAVDPHPAHRVGGAQQIELVLPVVFKLMSSKAELLSLWRSA